jgi:hypothetical protein
MLPHTYTEGAVYKKLEENRKDLLFVLKKNFKHARDENQERKSKRIILYSLF